MANLKDPKNPDLRERLMNGRLTPRQVATLDAKKLASAQQQAERELQEL
jgi:transcription elongation factor S-II